MSVLTESKIRAALRNKKIKEYKVNSQDIITPAARTFLKDNNIKLVVLNQNERDNLKAVDNKVITENKGMIPRFENIQGGYFEKKPEYMTQIKGNKLVCKDHPIVILRGKLDSMQAKILEVQVLCNKNGKDTLVKDLEECLGYVRNIMRAEVLSEDLESFSLLGMSDEEIREVSHNPQKYFNRGHIFPSYKMGEYVIKLNSLRSAIREVEICAIKAFKNIDGEISRLDIIRSLNRLSSLFYVMMCKCDAGYYK
ncbi:ethanolamine corrinoid cobalamin adenosyltransferase [Clostridium sediminicola]|uniref:cobalamin adenosyltransferase n=1 Tax=Clostridium sediminicola TaxID=3114879 RepID=UPI0031F1DE12